MKARIWIVSTLILGAFAFAMTTWHSAVASERSKATHAHGDRKEADQLEELFSKEEKSTPREHDEHDEHDSEGRDAHGDHGHSGEDDHDDHVVRLSVNELEEFGIELSKVAPGTLDQYIDLPGEIVLNEDRLAHVVPRVSGIAREIRKSLGDKVKTGEIIAILESRELAIAKTTYLSSVERENLARANFEREERLWQRKVTSEQEYLVARQSLAETRIEKTSAEQQLHALGFSKNVLKDLPHQPHITYTRYELSAPFAGTIIERHLALGENVSPETVVFTIADLSTVWVDINVYQKDLTRIHKGQSVVLDIGHGIAPVTGVIAWVSPLVSEGTRTAKARVVLNNPDGTLRPGLFVTARVAMGSSPATLVVKKSALQTYEDRTVVFVQTSEGFEPQPVEVGRQDATQVEILHGLKAGQVYVSKGAFTLKAQLGKSAFDDGHAH